MNTSVPAEPLMKAADVARLLNMSTSWVFKAAERGTLPCVRIGAALRFKPQDIQRFISSLNSQGATVHPLHSTR